MCRRQGGTLQEVEVVRVALYGPADATATPDWFYLSGTGSPR